MGFSVENFRSAISNGDWLSLDFNNVNGQKVPELKGKTKKDVIAVSDLKQMNGDDINKVANNLFLKGQLLTAIRDSLMSNKLMSVTREGSKETVSFHGQNADQIKAFFEEAEKALFGKQTNGKYGDDTASQDLASKTVQSLLDQLNDIVAPVKPGLSTVSIKSAGDETYDWTFFNIPENKLTTAQKELRANCPDATDKQREALINPDSKRLASCLGLKEKDAKALKVDSIKERSENGFLECELVGSKGRKYGVLVNRKGELLNKDDFDACAKLFEGGRRLLDTVSPQDLKSVRLLADQFVKSADIFYTKEENLNSLEGGTALSQWFSAMIIEALPRARALQPQGEIKQETWWAALRLDEIEQMPPSKNIQSNEVLAQAMTLRVRTDFASMVGCNLEDFSDMENLNRTDIDHPLFKVKQQYVDFLRSGSGGFRYTNALLNLKHHFIQGKEAYVKGHMPVLAQEVNIQEGDNAETIATLRLNKAKTELEDARAKGSVFRFGQHSFTNEANSAQQINDFCSRLQKSGFTPKQILSMSQVPNDTGIALLRDANFQQSLYNMDVLIEKDGEKMRVAYLFNCNDPSVDVNELYNSNRTPQRMRYEVVISPLGYAETVDFGLVEADQNHDENINNINNINNPPEEEGEEEINTSHQSKAMRPAGNDRIAPHFTDEQLNAIVYPNRKELASLLNVSIQEAKTAVFDDIRQAADGKSITCKVKRPDKPDAEVVVYGNGTIVSKATYDKTYADLSDTLDKIDAVGISKHVLSAFRREDYEQVRTYLDLFANLDELAYGEGTLLSKVFTGAVFVDLLAEKMGQIRQLQGKGVNMMDALWQSLQLPGKAPQIPKGKMSNQTKAAISSQLVTALRNRIYDDFAAAWGYDKTNLSNGFKALCVGSPTRNKNPQNQKKIPEAEKSLLAQRLGYFTSETGLSYSAKLRICQGHLNPPVTEKDFLYLTDPHVSDKNKSDDRRLHKAKNDITFARYVGMKWTYHLQQEQMSYENKAGNDSQANAMVDKWKEDGFTGKQIYQLGAYVNNCGVDLLKGFSSVPSGKGLSVDVSTGMVHTDGKKDMMVKVSMPIARPISINAATNGCSVLLTNYVVIHEFVLHPDGTSQAISERMAEDQGLANLPEKERKFEI